MVCLRSTFLSGYFIDRAGQVRPRNAWECYRDDRCYIGTTDKTHATRGDAYLSIALEGTHGNEQG